MARLIDPLAMPVPGNETPLSEALKAAARISIGDSDVPVLPAKMPGEREEARSAKTYRAARRNAKRDDPYGRDPELMEDFRNFLCLVWEFLGLPDPSPVQLNLAWWLQHGPDRAIILGFRGMAKSWITGAFILWTLYKDPQAKVLVISASLDRAVQTVQWCLALIREMPELQWLQPGINQRASGKQFDVGPATPDQSPSLRGAGINGQITGSRAHLIVPDDVEIPSNSMTTIMRDKIAENVKEFDAILHPGGMVKFLGTPQVDDSLYVKLTKRGYTMRIWPARFPDARMTTKYGERLSPWVYAKVNDNPTLVGHSVWPERFSDEDLQKRELSYGRSGFALQFMLDTSLSDADRYPLKLHDLIVFPMDMVYAPDILAWGNEAKLILNELPVMGFDGDHFYGPASKSESVSRYNSIVAWIDPSGRGGDETGLAIIGELHGRLYLLHSAGYRDGYAPDTLKALADAMVRYRVNKLLIEDNYGDGMFTALLTPYVVKAWEDFNSKRPMDSGGTDIEGVKSSKQQKELRILSVLEPATQQHRLAISTEVILRDYRTMQEYAEAVGTDTTHQYSLIHQFSHLTREKDCLLHDDRLESLAGAVSTFADILGINPWESANQRLEERMQDELDALLAEEDEIAGTGSRAERWHRGKTALRPT